jgi:hypothetical protein
MRAVCLGAGPYLLLNESFQRNQLEGRRRRRRRSQTWLAFAHHQISVAMMGSILVLQVQDKGWRRQWIVFCKPWVSY